MTKHGMQRETQAHVTRVIKIVDVILHHRKIIKIRSEKISKSSAHSLASKLTVNCSYVVTVSREDNDEK